MLRLKLSAAVVLSLALPIVAQESAPSNSETTLRLNSRAVLVDVIVTDKDGKPVTGLKKDAFLVKEQGKRQAVAFFEEHRGLAPEQQAKVQMPQLPPGVFSNFSPIAAPPAVNVLVLDALNTPMNDQMYLRQATERYLKALKPGTRLAIFTFSLRLHFIEGFSDDPAVLAAALGYRKNDRPEVTPLLQSEAETVGQSTMVGLMNQQVGAGPGATTSASPAALIQSFEQFMQETSYAQTSDREYRTLQAMQQLSEYLGSFPGRKNLIWLSGAFPLNIFGMTDMRFDDTVRATVNRLAASRVALYPVDVRGAWTYNLHSAEHQMDQTARTPQQFIGPAVDFPTSSGDSANINTGHDSVTSPSGNLSQSMASQSQENNSSNASMDMVAQQTGGRAFYNGNDLGAIIGKVVSSSSDFYTVSYTPTDSDMNGGFRKIEVNVEGGRYNLSYRRGYFARDEDKPGAAQAAQHEAVQAAATSNDPLQPFMDFGLPQSDQILYTVRLSPGAQKGAPEAGKNATRYAIDFDLDVKDLELKQEADGVRKGGIVLSMIVYDRYGQVASRRDHRIPLAIKPEAWDQMEKGGLPLHADMDVPNGQYWLRTGVYDQSTHKVGTMQVPFTAVHAMQATEGVPAQR